MSESNSLPSRADFLISHFADSLRAQNKLSDWRVALGWLAFSGALVAAVALASYVPGASFLVVVTVAGAVFFFIMSWRAQARRISRWLSLEESTAGGEWDMTGVEALDPVYLYPEDARTAEQLERVLRPTAEDKRRVAADAKELITTTYLTLTLVFVGLAAFLLALFGFPGDLEPQHRALLFAASIPLMAAMTQSSLTLRAAQRLYKRLVERSEQRAGLLWQHDATFSEGRVIKQEAEGYAVDPSGLPLGAVPAWKKAWWWALLFGLTVIGVAAALIFGPATGVLPALH